MLNIIVLIGIVILVALGQWTIISGKAQALGGFEFQVILVGLMAYILLTGNKGLGHGKVAFNSSQPKEKKENDNLSSPSQICTGTGYVSMT